MNQKEKEEAKRDGSNQTIRQDNLAASERKGQEKDKREQEECKPGGA